ncbi:MULTISPECIES: hypothetical protein [Nostocales]|uniref:Uncharacterized protein n=3 Tax=Nostocales TaxID=1161 RepID=A0A8S9TFZ2_9CYAN|nr:hypothetical protein [Tolypothrix bouteillei]KAF3890389.1 hypothetical protein DA73_0400036790 [Tolypothrix bouteillei VB521301]
MWRVYLLLHHVLFICIKKTQFQGDRTRDCKINTFDRKIMTIPAKQKLNEKNWDDN